MYLQYSKKWHADNFIKRDGKTAEEIRKNSDSEEENMDTDDSDDDNEENDEKMEKEIEALKAQVFAWVRKMINILSDNKPSL